MGGTDAPRYSASRRDCTLLWCPRPSSLDYPDFDHRLWNFAQSNALVEPDSQRGAIRHPMPIRCFSTRGLAATMRLGEWTIQQAKRNAPACKDIIVINNANDKAVENSTTEHTATLWRKRGATVREFCFDADLGIPHDCIDKNSAQRQDRHRLCQTA